MSVRCVFAFLFVALLGAPHAACAAASGDVALGALAKHYYESVWRFSPPRATEVGVHYYDSRLGNYRAADFAALIARLHSMQAEVEALDAGSLSFDGRVDRAILLNALRQRLYELEERPAWRLTPGYYTSIASGGVYGIMSRSFASAAARLSLISARERQIPAVLAQARANLMPARIPSIVARVGMLDADGAVDFFSKDLPAAFATVTDKQLQRRFKASNDAAIEALRSYSSFIRTAVLPKAHAPYAIGAAAYQRLEDLQNIEHIPLSKIEAAGEAALAHDKAAFIATAGRIDAGKSPQQVQSMLGKDHPAPAQLLAVARQGLVDLLAFIKSKKLIDVPAAPLVRVIPTPQFEAQSSFASMDSPGPLEKTATEAYYRITLLDPSWSSQRAAQHLTQFSRFKLPLISLHEAYPGHYTNYLFNKKAHLSLTRQLEWNPAFGEGWAHYDEQMMVDEGWGGGDPKVRLAQLALALQRDCRYLVGIREHTQGMSVDEATHFFMDNAFMAREPSYREALRGTMDPLYGYYTLGKLAILKLRSDYQHKMGAAYSLRKFHDALLSHGDPPLYFIRRIMLGEKDRGTLL